METGVRATKVQQLKIVGVGLASRGRAYIGTTNPMSISFEASNSILSYEAASTSNQNSSSTQNQRSSPYPVGEMEVSSMTLMSIIA